LEYPPSILDDDSILDILRASNISPPKEEVKGPEPPPKVIVKPSKKIVTANDIREEIKTKMENLRQEIKDGLNTQLKEYEGFLKGQRELNKQNSSQGITKEQAKKSYANFEKSLKNSEEFKDKIKQFNLLKASLLDDDSPAGISAKQNIQNLADARNFEITKKGQKPSGKEYLERKVEEAKKELVKKEDKYLIDDPANPGRKKLNPNLELGIKKVDDEEYERVENQDLGDLYIYEQEKNKNDPAYKPRFIYYEFNDNEDIKRFENEHNKGIDFIDKKDRYMIDTFIDNMFDIKQDSPIPIIYDINMPAIFKDIEKYSDAPQVGIQNIDYIITKYISNIPDRKTRKERLDDIISYIIKKMKDNYYIYNEDDNYLNYSNYINNFIEQRYSRRKEEGNDSYKSDVANIPKITNIKNRLDKINTKRITIQDKLDVARLWNDLFKRDKGFTKIWTYMGLDQNNFYGKRRGTKIWNRMFKNNPSFSQEHNLFAIGNLEEELARYEKIKNIPGNIVTPETIKNDFINDNINFFQSKGETLTKEQALQLFTDIINSIRQKNITPPTAGTKINTLSSTKGSGISKRKILKYLKGKSSISKPTIKGLDTEIFKILNS
jgi:hypothetical protein